jgi:hypothetical protein
MPRHLHLSLALLYSLAAACGDVSTPPGPRVIPGGGIGDGKISNTLFVHVMDDDTRKPVSSASVRVGTAAAAAPCEVLTDSTGLATFDATNCPMLKGPVTLTASAAGYAPATWIGANGTNLTVPVRARTRPAIDSATVSGTIAGWDSLPAPAANHMTLAIIGYSQSRQLGDAANEIPQGTRSVNAMLGAVTTPLTIPANVCVRRQETLVSVNDCNWQLQTRVGAQAVYAVILDQDTKGTEADTDDTQTVVGWALKTSQTFTAMQQVTGVSLELVTDDNMQPFTAAFASPPSGMDHVGAFPMIDIGDAGRIPVILPALDLTHLMTRVPKAAGQLANAKYDLLAAARDAADQAEPASIAWLRGVNASGTVEVKSWMLPPTALSATGGTFSFAPAAGATVHAAELNDAMGARAWSISIFDGSSSFTLPGLSPDPLPLGMVQFKVSAMKVPGVDLGNVAFDAVAERLTDMSSDVVMFSR